MTMKKIILTVMGLGLLQFAMAQQMTPEEKTALKAAQKEAEAQRKMGIKLRDEINLLYNEKKAEIDKGEKGDKKLIAKNDSIIKKTSSDAIDILVNALNSGHVSEKKLFEGYKALEDVGTYLMNPELELAAANEPFDTLSFAKAVDAVCDGCYGVISHGNKKDDTQKLIIVNDELKIPKLMTYYAYLCQFYITSKNLSSAEQALDKYANFGKRYPLVAEDEKVKNPQIPISQFAFNIYLTAFNNKQYDICEKYYDMAAEYKDQASHNFVIGSLPQIYKEQKDTVKWVNALKAIADREPDSEAAESAIQNLLSIYTNYSNDKLNKIAEELLAKYPNSKVTNYGKGYSLFVQEKYDEGFTYFEKALEIDPSYANAVFMAGTCKYRQAMDNYYKKIENKKFKSQAEMSKAEETYVKHYFRIAQKYFERYQELKPEETSQWAGPLENIYKNTGQTAKANQMRSLLDK